jgi:hypothetical protein
MTELDLLLKSRPPSDSIAHLCALPTADTKSVTPVELHRPQYVYLLQASAQHSPPQSFPEYARLEAALSSALSVLSEGLSAVYD